MIIHYLSFLGQFLFGLFFIVSGFNHFKNAASLAGYAGSKGVPYPKLAILGSGALLLVGGAGIMTGDFVFWAILALVIFLLPVSFVMHAYWNDTDPGVRAGNRVNFTKNMALLGALFILWSLPMLVYKI